MNDVANPLVSVVIPTYNHARYLGRALQSVIDQTYTNWEAIIIDNHSTDNTDEVVASFVDSRITYLKIHNNGVIAASRNAGIRLAKGEWIAFLDSDDWWTADKLQVCFDSINYKVDFIYHDLEIVSDQPRIFRRKTIKSRQVKTPVLMDLLLKGNPIANSSVVVRRHLLEKIGGIDEQVEMIAAEDYNAWLRIAQQTELFIYLPYKLGYYFQHNQNISQKKDPSASAQYAVVEFFTVLNNNQKLELEVGFRYISGRFSYRVGNYKDAKKKLVYVFCHGSVTVMMKVLILLLVTMLRDGNDIK
jgi:glycosyltransferase involved in cell wall biosynthesis